MSSQDPTIKLLLIGPSNSGKTALLLRYVDDIFDTDNATATIGVDFKVKKVSVKGKPHRLLLFDTAGQGDDISPGIYGKLRTDERTPERFRTLTSSYYRNAQGVILVYDVSSRESFLSMGHWFGEAETYASPGVIKCLVGSKIDRIGSRTVKREEGEALAKKYGATFYECSSKTRENIREPFVTTVDRIVDTPQLMDPALLGRRDGTVALRPRTDEEIASGCSC